MNTTTDPGGGMLGRKDELPSRSSDVWSYAAHSSEEIKGRSGPSATCGGPLGPWGPRASRSTSSNANSCGGADVELSAEEAGAPGSSEPLKARIGESTTRVAAFSEDDGSITCSRSDTFTLVSFPILGLRRSLRTKTVIYQRWGMLSSMQVCLVFPVSHGWRDHTPLPLAKRLLDEKTTPRRYYRRSLLLLRCPPGPPVLDE